MEKIFKANEGDIVNYGAFSDVVIKGKDKKHVFLEDKSGNKKKVYVELFNKYGKLTGRNINDKNK